MSKVAKNEFDEMIGAPDFQDNLGEIINPKLEKIAANRFEQKFQHLLEARIHRIKSMDMLNQRCNPCRLKIIDTIDASKVNSILEEYEKLKQSSIPKKNDMKINNGKNNCKKRKSLLRNVQFQKRVDELFDLAIPEKTVEIDQEIDQIIKYLIEQIQEILKKMERCEQCYQIGGNKKSVAKVEPKKKQGCLGEVELEKKHGNEEQNDKVEPEKKQGSGDQKTFLNIVEPTKKQSHGESVAKVEPKKNQGCLEEVESEKKHGNKEQNDKVEPEKKQGSGGRKTFLNIVEPTKKQSHGESVAKVEPKKKRGSGEKVEPEKKRGNKANKGQKENVEPTKKKGYGGQNKVEPRKNPDHTGLVKSTAKVEHKKKQGSGEKVEPEKKQGNKANKGQKENVEPTKNKGYGGQNKVEPKKNPDHAGLGKSTAKVEPMKKEGHIGKIEPEKKQGNGTNKGQDEKVDVGSICPLCDKEVTGKDKSTCYRNVCRHIRNIHDKDPEDFEIKTEIKVQPTKKRGREGWDKNVSEVEPKKKRARNVKNKN